MIKKHFSWGIYAIPALILISFSLFFTSCTKEEEIAPTSTISEVTTTTPELRVSSVLPDLFGFYTQPTNLVIGSASSENATLTYLKNKGGNMLNCYARNSMNTSTGRSQFAAFCRKAYNSYGVKLITCDIRETTEIANWTALYSAYPDLASYVAPLTEKEPWVTYDYAGCFSLLRKTKNMCNQFGAKFYFYEGWMGKNYSNPQRAVDSMVYYCDGVFLSNYVSVSDYMSTASGYGKWDNRMKLRVNQGNSTFGGITLSAKKFNKLDYPIIELQSLEPSFLLSIYSNSGYAKSFYGSTYTDAKTIYNASPADVITYTQLKGKSLFYQKYVLQAQP